MLDAMILSSSPVSSVSPYPSERSIEQGGSGNVADNEVPHADPDSLDAPREMRGGDLFMQSEVSEQQNVPLNIFSQPENTPGTARDQVGERVGLRSQSFLGFLNHTRPRAGCCSRFWRACVKLFCPTRPPAGEPTRHFAPR